MTLSFLSAVGVKTRRRKLVLMLVDFLVISFSYLLSWFILMRRISLIEVLPMMFLSAICFIVLFIIIYLLFGMYESLWRYAEAYEFIKCMIATVVAAGLFILITGIWFRPPYVSSRIPITVYFLSSMMAGMGTLFVRMAYRAYRSTRMGSERGAGVKKTMIVGAGETGTTIMYDFHRQSPQRYEVLCFVDDSHEKIGRRISNVKVEGSTEDIPKLAEKHGIQVIILAISSASSEDVKRITNICAKTKCQLKKVPDLRLLVADSQSYAQEILDVSIEDLLGRDVVDVGAGKSTYLEGKVVMVTGAGGSIGSELCRHIMRRKPKSLVMVDIAENGLYDIQQELLRGGASNDVPICAEVASVRDAAKIDMLFARFRPEVVYHAAAHKHVPLMESAPEEAVKNNIFGTLNAARCAEKHGAERFVLISTDKAVNPTNVMGASKRVCEMIVQCMARESRTCFVAVRFGNVLGSSGSVVPLFKSQIVSGGPVTVTHPEVIRYFMTISEAVSLVMIAGEMAQGGEISVLDMGEPVKILDLAESLIRLSGYEPYKDIDISFVGLRPGEKLFEELLMGEEGLRKTLNQKIFIGTPLEISPERLFPLLDEMNLSAQKNDAEELMKRLYELVPGYTTELGVRS